MSITARRSARSATRRRRSSKRRTAGTAACSTSPSPTSSTTRWRCASSPAPARPGQVFDLRCEVREKLIDVPPARAPGGAAAAAQRTRHRPVAARMSATAKPSGRVDAGRERRNSPGWVTASFPVGRGRRLMAPGRTSPSPRHRCGSLNSQGLASHPRRASRAGTAKGRGRDENQRPPLLKLFLPLPVLSPSASSGAGVRANALTRPDFASFFGHAAGTKAERRPRPGKALCGTPLRLILRPCLPRRRPRSVTEHTQDLVVDSDFVTIFC